MAAISFDDLINVERTALEAQDAVKSTPYSAEGRPWFDTAATFQAKVTECVNAEGKVRVSVETDVKKAVRHAASAEGVA
ncbi:hypothetical protein ACIQVL_05085 [Streptomyces sp. NPDC090499]|uniref:hypothetical protein n=1 Tax=Streptomyces sp. NPDC090499 TaxID=3365965 RepID=UPI0037FD1161